MVTQIACPRCEGGRVSFSSQKINLATGKPIQGACFAYILLILGLIFSAAGGYLLVSAGLNPISGQMGSQVCYTAGMGFFLGFSLLGYGGRLIAQRRGDKAEVYHLRCKDCKHEWREWEEGVDVTKKMERDWYLKDIETEKGAPRTKAIRALGNLGDEKVLGTLLGILNDTRFLNLHDRIAAAEALGKIGDPGATEALVQALEDNNLVETAARSLGMIGDPTAIGALENATQHKNQRVQAAAQEAIDKIKKAHPELSAQDEEASVPPTGSSGE